MATPTSSTTPQSLVDHEAADVGAARSISLPALSLLALLVGIVAGIGALVFRALIAIVHNLFYYGTLSLEHDANVFGPPSVWGPFFILAPVVGGLIVVWIVKTFAPEAKGHGVPEVMDAIYYREGRIRPAVAFAKILASAFSIGSGGSVGREGPIIQIGSSFGSTMGQLLPMATWQRITLVASGAGAGIAATFNTPLAGVLFSVELLMPEVSARTFLPVVIATGTATFVGRMFLGAQPAFIVPLLDSLDFERIGLSTLLACAVLGVLCGAAAWAFIRVLTMMEVFFERLKVNDYVANMGAMLVLGLLLYVLYLGFGHYYVDGVGYATVQAILTNEMTAFWLLLLLFVGKLFATSLTLGGGGSGGVFAPSLFMGATLGGAFGALATAVFGHTGFTVGEYGMIGMAALVGGGTGAAMTAIVMIFEMVRDYHVVFPAIVATALAIGMRRALSDENIYTIKLAWRGHRIPKDRHSGMYLVRHAEEVMSRAVVAMDASATVQEGLRGLPKAPDSQYILVVRGRKVLGVILVTPSMHALEEVSGAVTLGEICDRQLTVAAPDQSMFDVFRRMARRKARYVLVVDRPGVPRVDTVRGLIARAQITDAVIANFGPGNA
jgi:CIC family chloride channel protein